MSDPVQKVVSWKADFTPDGDVTRNLIRLADETSNKLTRSLARAEEAVPSSTTSRLPAVKSAKTEK